MHCDLRLAGVLQTIVFIGLVSALPWAASATEKPNVVLIMADDMGYECLSAHGNESWETPHLDALAASGMRFDHAHSQPICTPSRVQIMTGIYNNRNYVRFGLLDPEAVTFGNLLEDAGYRTCIAGKWQLQGGFEGPRRFGFEQYCLWQLTRRPSRYPNPGLEIDGEERDFKNGEFGPNLVTDYLIEFFKERAEDGEPFFAYYPMILPHWPFVPTPGSDDWDPAMWRDAGPEPNSGPYKKQKYWEGMVRYTDKMAGKIVNALGELGLSEKTLVIFTCDNGTYSGVSTQFRGKEFGGGKGSTADNGTHVPFLVSWPGTIEPGQVRQELVDFSDVVPTLLDVAGVEKPEGLDGRSLEPLFRGGALPPREPIYCYYSRNGVREAASEHVRDARYKLYADGRLFDTVEDPLEASALPESGIPESLRARVDRLKVALERHRGITKASDPRIEARRRALSGKRQSG